MVTLVFIAVTSLMSILCMYLFRHRTKHREFVIDVRAILAVQVLIVTLTSCGTARRLPGATVADAVWALSEARPEGFTVEISTMTEPGEGISVAYAETQGSCGRDGLEAAVTHATSHDGFVGGWRDSEDGQYYFDSVRLFPEDSLQAAVNFGKANFQKALYVLSTGEEIRLQEDMEYVSPTNLIIFYDTGIGKEPLLEAIKDYGATILYDYSIIPGVAVRIPEGKDIIEAIEYFAAIKGVTSVERDHIYHLVEPVRLSFFAERPRFELGIPLWSIHAFQACLVLCKCLI